MSTSGVHARRGSGPMSTSGLHARSISGPVTAPRAQVDREIEIEDAGEAEEGRQAPSGAPLHQRGAPGLRAWSGCSCPRASRPRWSPRLRRSPCPPPSRWWWLRRSPSSRRPAPEKKMVRFHVSTEPAGAHVFIGRHDMGSTPTVFELPAGCRRDGQRRDGAGARRLPDAGHHLRWLGRRGGERQAAEEGRDAGREAGPAQQARGGAGARRGQGAGPRSCRALRPPSPAVAAPPPAAGPARLGRLDRAPGRPPHPRRAPGGAA